MCSSQQSTNPHRCADGRHQVVQLHICGHVRGREHVLLPRQCVRSDRRWGPARHVAARLPRAARISQPLGDAMLCAGARRAAAGTQASHTLETLPHDPQQTPSCCCCSRLHSHQGAARRPAWPSSSVRTTTSPISDAAGRAVLSPTQHHPATWAAFHTSQPCNCRQERVARDIMSKGPRTVNLGGLCVRANGPCSAVKRGQSDVMIQHAFLRPRGACFGTRLSGCSKNPAQFRARWMCARAGVAHFIPPPWTAVVHLDATCVWQAHGTRSCFQPRGRLHRLHPSA